MSKIELTLLPSDDLNKIGDKSIQIVGKNNDFPNFVEIYPKTVVGTKRINSLFLRQIPIDIDVSTIRKKLPKRVRKIGLVARDIFNNLPDTDNKNFKNVIISNGVQDTVLGSDPEFLIFDGEDVIAANRILKKETPLGSDGAMAELRPDPEMYPKRLTANIKKLFESRYTKHIKNLKWIVTNYYKDKRRDYPVGFHIHIGNPAQLSKMELNERIGFFATMNKILDELVAIPLIKIEGISGKHRRVDCGMGRYGYYGELRVDIGRLEYRTLSGMCLLHPKLTESIFALVKVIVNEIFKVVNANNFDKKYMFNDKFIDKEYKKSGLAIRHKLVHNVWDDKFNSWSEIGLAADFGCIAPTTIMKDLLHTSNDKLITVRMLTGWYNKIRNMESYKEYSREVDYLYDILKNVPTKYFLDYNRDIRDNWLGNPDFF